MRHPSRALPRLGLLAGVAVAALTVGQAQAAEPVRTARADPSVCQGPCPRPAVTVADLPAPSIAEPALGDDGFYLESDELIDNTETLVVTARGSVEARYQGRTVRADELEYRRRTGVVIARGNAVIINADGSVQNADEVELDQGLSTGVAIGFSTQLAQNVTIVAASVVRRSETVSDLNRAVYTPCPLCTPEGRSRTPTFSLQAERVTQDRSRRLIYYRNAVLRVKDIPVFYLPVFFHPDPTAERASGFLVPDIGYSSRRGFTYEQPYYQVIDPSQDIIISPQFNEKVNPFLNLEYRKRFYSGTVEARVGYTVDQDFDSDGEKFGDDTSRSYVLADGKFDITEDWRWGFTAERTSDDLLFRKYDIGRVFRDRGLYQADSQRLLSQLYTVRSTERTYLSFAALSFQGLRPTDDDGTFPTVAPLVEGRFEPEQRIAGGRLRVRGSGVALTRDEGVDSRRATLEADWRRPITLASGLRVEPLAMVRGDHYSVGDGGPGQEETVSRGNATVGVIASYPLIRRTARGSVLLEPLLEVLVSPDAKDSGKVPNEDSVVLTFDETNLFDTNRYPGFDRYEGGQRVNVGGRATFDFGGGRDLMLFGGRSFRAERDLAFSPTSGLREKASDYVVAASTTPYPGLYFFTRARLDGETGEVRRAEAAANANVGRVQGGLRYYFDDANVRGVRTHEVDASGQILLTRNYGVILSGVRDLEAKAWRRRDIGLLYQDECLRLEIVYEREETFNRALGPSEGISVRLALATLGDTGYTDYDER